MSAELLLPIDPASAVPLRVQLERELRLAVQSGRIKSGAALPSSRSLAATLGVSRGVVVAAYEQLCAEGYFSPSRGSGTRVASRVPAARASARSDAVVTRSAAPVFEFDLRPGMPDLGLFPQKAWLACLRDALKKLPDSALGYPDIRGPAVVRQALAAYLNRSRATVAQAEGLLMCGGTAQAIALLCQVLREKGIRRIAVEDPCLPEHFAQIRALGLEVKRIAVDGDGIRVDALEKSGAQAVLVTPNHQFPTGVVLSAPRRGALLRWAAACDGIVIEDDYDAEYRYDAAPIGALQGLAPHRVVYVGSASKMLAPGLRLGWIAAPARWTPLLFQAKRIADRGSPVIDQLALGEFLRQGGMDRHLRRTRKVYRQRRDVLIASLQEHLPAWEFSGAATGLHLMLKLGAGIGEIAAVQAAAEASVRVHGASYPRVGYRTGEAALILGYGGILESRIVEAVERLALAFRSMRRI